MAQKSTAEALVSTTTLLLKTRADNRRLIDENMAMRSKLLDSEMRYLRASGERAVLERSLEGANKGIRRLRARLDRIYAHMVAYQQWPLFRADERKEQLKRKAEWDAKNVPPA